MVWITVNSWQNLYGEGANRPHLTLTSACAGGRAVGSRAAMEKTDSGWGGAESVLSVPGGWDNV